MEELEMTQKLRELLFHRTKFGFLALTMYGLQQSLTPAVGESIQANPFVKNKNINCDSLNRNVPP